VRVRAVARAVVDQYGYGSRRREFADAREVLETLRPADVDDALLELNVGFLQREPRAHGPARGVLRSGIEDSGHTFSPAAV
jgi:hypothetical protein